MPLPLPLPLPLSVSVCICPCPSPPLTVLLFPSGTRLRVGVGGANYREANEQRRAGPSSHFGLDETTSASVPSPRSDWLLNISIVRAVALIDHVITRRFGGLDFRDSTRRWLLPVRHSSALAFFTYALDRHVISRNHLRIEIG